jgi:hypothetical protein
MKLPYRIIRSGGLPQMALQAIATQTNVPIERLLSAERTFVGATYGSVVLKIEEREVARHDFNGATIGGDVEQAFYVGAESLPALRADSYQIVLAYRYPIADYSSLTMTVQSEQVTNAWVNAFRQVTRSSSSSGGRFLFFDFSSRVTRTQVRESVSAGGSDQQNSSIEIVLRDPTPQQVERVEAVLGFAKLTREQMLARHQAAVLTAIAAGNPQLAAAHEKYMGALESDTPSGTAELLAALSELKDADALSFMAAGFQMREGSASNYYRYDYGLVVSQTSQARAEYREYVITNASVTAAYFAHLAPGMTAAAIDRAYDGYHSSIFGFGLGMPLDAQQWAQGVRGAIDRNDAAAVQYSIGDAVIERVRGYDPDIVIDADGNRLLHRAARRGNLAVVRALTRGGASPLRRNLANDRPLDLAQDQGNESIIDYLNAETVRRGRIRVVLSHPGVTVVGITASAPQSLPLSTQALAQGSTEITSTDYPRRVRLNVVVKIRFNLPPFQCSQVMFPHVIQYVQGGCVVQTEVPFAGPVRYPADQTSEYRWTLQLVNFQQGFVIQPELVE